LKAMSTYSPLPHIIGSEEYNHDNSCGLAGNTDFFSFFLQKKFRSFYGQIHLSLFIYSNR
jgi:hypothetical protein